MERSGSEMTPECLAAPGTGRTDRSTTTTRGEHQPKNQWARPSQPHHVNNVTETITTTAATTPYERKPTA
jgi:hypothetical protein